MVNVPESFIDTFAKQFGRQPEVVVRSPGRVNLIGEHTDYNEGFVMPVATEQGFWVAAGRREDNLLSRPQRGPGRGRARGTWRSRCRRTRGSGAVTSAGWRRCCGGRATRSAGPNLLISGDLPVGSGLSSSAALEVGVAIALLTANDAAARVGDRVNLAHLCRKAEHEYAGVPCGIMDQYACLMGQEDRAILLDCREHLPRADPDAG